MKVPAVNAPPPHQPARKPSSPEAPPAAPPVRHGDPPRHYNPTHGSGQAPQGTTIGLGKGTTPTGGFTSAVTQRPLLGNGKTTGTFDRRGYRSTPSPGGAVKDFDSANGNVTELKLATESRRPSWSTIAMVAGVVALIIGGIAFLSQFRSDSAGPVEAAPFVEPTVDQLAQSTVQIFGLGGQGQALCSGSGTFVSTDGLILTNAHVVTKDELCDFVSLGVAVTDDAGRPPELLYLAELMAIDYEVDLAVIRVARSVDGEREVPEVFPALSIGDSDDLTIGDDLRILGYPEIGGETITFTNGSVSGFTAQAGIGDRALIKTDATIVGGNSGGAAVDLSGHLVGIPTKARASESGPAVDCRPLADTNSDGLVDSNDNCVPIGGFLNGIRPISLAMQLVRDAETATPQPFVPAEPAVTVELGNVTVSRPRFSLGETNDAPATVIRTATQGINELCLFVDWQGIPDGAEWDGIWYYNRELVDEFSLVKQVWEFGEEGHNFWMCAIDDRDGLEGGLYELGFFLSGELVFAEGILLTDEPVEVFNTTWENATESDICELAINPKGSGPVGLNELPDGTVIPPGGTTTINLPEGEAVVEAYDCDGNAVADSAGLNIVPDENRIYFIEVPESPLAAAEGG